MVMRRIFFSLFVVLSLLSASCTSALPSFKPYKMDIQQGNVVTSKMMLQLRPGMSKSQVRFIMGTPLIQDSFHVNRWDYFYQMRKGGKIVEQRRVILDFKDEALLRVRGDVIPAGTGDGIAEPSTGTEPVSQPEDKKSLMDKLKFWKKDEKETAKPQSAPTELVTPAAKKPAVKEPAAKEPEATKEVPSVIAIPPAAEPEPATPEPVIPEPVPAVESKPEAKPMPAPEPEPAPAPIVEPAKPEPVKSEPVKSEPVKVEEPAPVVKPEPAPEPVPQKQIEAPVPQPAPEPAAEPMAKPVEKTTEKPPEKPAEKATEKPEVKAKPPAETKPVPTPEKEPEEDEPGYFEYMLQKIGF